MSTAFVNQKIETPEQLRRFEALHLRSPATGQPVRPFMWTVDEERDFRLVAVGGGVFEIPHLFVFVVPGGTLEIESDRKGEGSLRDGTARVDWNVSTIRIPRILASRALELLDALTEALIVHGRGYTSLPPGHVHVTLPSPTFF